MVENEKFEHLFSINVETNPDKIIRVKSKSYKELPKKLPVGKGNKTLDK